jgi:peptidoglycan hydrolase CwlO-like protein
MKKNSKFLLIYIAILFSFALVLILFAGLTQNNYAKELAESQGIKQNLIEVTEQYQTLTDSMKSLNKNLEDANKQIETYEEDINQKANQILLTDKLVEAMRLIDTGRPSAAKEILTEIDKETLTENQRYIYNKLMIQGGY